MQIKGTLHVESTLNHGRSSTLNHGPLSERFEAEIARVHGLSDDALESLSTLIGATNLADVARKLCRFVVAAVSPGATLERLFDQDPQAAAEFCLQLSAYHTFIDKVAGGERPATAANELARVHRDWILHALEAREYGRDLYADEDIDVFGPDGVIDIGAVRAEIDRLLRRLHVDPDEIRVLIAAETPE
jgi:hypothetical protein